MPPGELPEPGSPAGPPHPLRQAESRARMGELESIGTRQVRLVVWLPALMLLYTLLVAIWLHLYLDSAAEGFPTAALQEQAKTDAERVLYVGILGAMLSGLVGAIVAWQVVRPLRQLNASMVQVAHGDLSAAQIRANLGELQTLNLTFNQMVGQLQMVFEQRDRQMREAAIGSSVMLDRSGRVLATDDFLGRVLGINPDDIRGIEITSGLSRLVSREANRVFLDSIRRILAEAASGRTGTSACRYLGPGQKEARLLSLRAAQLDSGSEQGPAWLLDIRDLTSMEPFYLEMQRADRLAAVGTLATGIAHEIRNPLASIRAISQLLREDLRGQAESRPADYLSRVEREVDRLDRLVRSIMEFSRQEETPPVHVDVNKLLQETLEAARARVEPDPAMPVAIEWGLDPNIPIIYADEPRLSQALLNLMINALEELRKHGGKLVVCSRWNPKSRARPIELRLSNTGDPIPEELHERLFEPFYTTKPEGTGLGLPIAYQIIVSQGGMLEVRCADGMVHFMVRLPVAGHQSLAYTDDEEVIIRPDSSPPGALS